MAATSAPAASAELLGRIGWLVRLRWVAIAGVAVFLQIAPVVFPVELAVRPLYGVLIGLAVYNVGLELAYRRLRRSARRPPPPDRAAATPDPSRTVAQGERESSRAAAFANAQISLDLVALALLLHFSGGIENPFISFFVFHVVIASILLSRRATYLQTTLGYALVTAVAGGEYAGLTAHYPLGGVWHPDAYRDPELVGGTLFVLGATLYIAAYMGSTIAAHLRKRERMTLHLSQEVAEQAKLLQTAYERLAATERAKSDYMRKVAHELRGPLGTIQTSLKVVLERASPGLGDELRTLLGRAEIRAGELAHVTRDLLELSRAREARLEAERGIVDLADVVTATVGELAESAHLAGVTLRAQVPERGAALVGDSTDLERLVRNLVANGLRYTPPGGSVDVRLERHDRGLRMTVEDTGIGIAPADLPKIFGEFYRAPNARAHAAEGTGLGLAIVKSVVDQHGGTIDVVSRLGLGSRFTVELPAS